MRDLWVVRKGNAMAPLSHVGIDRILNSGRAALGRTYSDPVIATVPKIKRLMKVIGQAGRGGERLGNSTETV